MRGIKLKRCPFCGKKVTIASMSDEDEHWFYVHGVFRDDDHCRCRVFMESEKYRDGATKEEIKAIRSELVAKWNRRNGCLRREVSAANGKRREGTHW